MTFWIITYHHRHGVDVWPVWQDDEPDLDVVAAAMEEWEPDREEWLDHTGPFPFPNPTPELLEALADLVCCPAFTGARFEKDPESHKAWTLARAAIAKARGE